MEGRRAGRADPAHQHEPDHRRGEAGKQHRVAERQRQRRRPDHLPGLEQQRDREQQRAADQHLQPDDHPEIAGPGRAPDQQRRDAERQQRADAERDRQTGSAPACSRAVMMTSTPATPAASPSRGERRQPLAERDPGEARDHQRQQARDDDGDAGVEVLQREEVEPEIERVLAQAEHPHRHPLRAVPRQALAERDADAERDQPRDQEPHRQREERRRVGHDDVRRGEGRAPHRDERHPERERPPVHRPPPEMQQAAPCARPVRLGRTERDAIRR